MLDGVHRALVLFLTPCYKGFTNLEILVSRSILYPDLVSNVVFHEDGGLWY